LRAKGGRLQHVVRLLAGSCIRQRSYGARSETIKASTNLPNMSE
jgi:hypothetical protein